MINIRGKLQEYWKMENSI